MTERYRSNLSLPHGDRACASCGRLWRWQRGNGRIGTRKPDWEGAGLSLCQDCLKRIHRLVANGKEPTDPAERLALYAWAGVELSRRSGGKA